MTIFDFITLLLMSLGLLFFLGGTLGFIRFPDLESKLHALTKADNLGLGLIVLSLAFQQSTLGDIIKLLMIWLAMMTTSASLGYLIGKENKETAKQ